MKKLLIIAFCYLTTHVAFAENVKLYNENKERRLLINYQICNSDDPYKNSIECDPPVRNITIEKNQSTTDIPVEANVFFVRVISAYQFDDEGIVSAKGEFSSCHAYSFKPIIIGQIIDNPRFLVCK